MADTEIVLQPSEGLVYNTNPVGQSSLSFNKLQNIYLKDGQLKCFNKLKNTKVNDAVANTVEEPILNSQYYLDNYNHVQKFFVFTKEGVYFYPYGKAGLKFSSKYCQDDVYVSNGTKLDAFWGTTFGNNPTNYSHFNDVGPYTIHFTEDYAAGAVVLPDDKSGLTIKTLLGDYITIDGLTCTVTKDFTPTGNDNHFLQISSLGSVSSDVSWVIDWSGLNKPGSGAFYLAFFLKGYQRPEGRFLLSDSSGSISTSTFNKYTPTTGVSGIFDEIRLIYRDETKQTISANSIFGLSSLKIRQNANYWGSPEIRKQTIFSCEKGDEIFWEFTNLRKNSKSIPNRYFLPFRLTKNYFEDVFSDNVSLDSDYSNSSYKNSFIVQTPATYGFRLYSSMVVPANTTYAKDEFMFGFDSFKFNKRCLLPYSIKSLPQSVLYHYNNYTALYVTALGLPICKIQQQNADGLYSCTAIAPTFVGVSDEPLYLSAKYICLAGDRLFIGNVQNGESYYPTRIHWSNIYAPENFAVSDTTESDYFDLGIGEQEITGLAYANSIVYIFTQTSIWQSVYEGFENQFKTTKFTSDIGNYHDYSVITVQDVVYFISTNNFYKLENQTLTPIGDAIWSYFYDTHDHNLNDIVTSQYDDKNKIIFWSYSSKEGKTITLGYSIENGQWFKYEHSLQ